MADRTLAIIGGTGLDHWGETRESRQEDTPYGEHSGPVSVFEVGHVRLLFLPRHGARHHLPPHCVNYRANLWALKSLGASTVLAVNAVGGITAPVGGTLLIPDQVIDYTHGREHTFSDSGDVRLVHTEFAEPFEGPLRQKLIRASERAGLDPVVGGCIGVCQGPRFETAAEIRRMRRDGCDVVGMTTMPEAALAAELGLDYAAVHVVSNAAAGVSDEIISEEAIAETLKIAMADVRRLVSSLLEAY